MDDEEKTLLDAFRARKQIEANQKENLEAAAVATARAKWLADGGFYHAHSDIENGEIREAIEKLFCAITQQETDTNAKFKKLESMGPIERWTLGGKDLREFLVLNDHHNRNIADRAFNILANLKLIPKGGEAERLHKLTEVSRKRRLPVPEPDFPFVDGGCQCRKPPVCERRCPCAKVHTHANMHTRTYIHTHRRLEVARRLAGVGSRPAAPAMADMAASTTRAFDN